MVRQFGLSTVLAIVLGGVLAVAAFLPVVAVRYRKAGRLRLIDLVMLLGVATYAVALWTYTLVPLPDSDSFRCAPANLRPFAFLADIRAEGGSLWRNRALFQALFNVVLFMPLGVFLRVLARKGVAVATGVGMVITLAIELTQRTGIWGLYHCAYRTFDVDDLILNTVGATLGSVLAIPVAAMLSRNRRPVRVTTVTLGRRLMGMLADVLAIGIVGYGAVLIWRAIGLYLLGMDTDALPAWADQTLAVGLPGLVEAFWVLTRGRTVGEDIVQLEPTAPTGQWWSRPLKFAFGAGGWLVVTAVADALVTALFVGATLIAAWRSRDHRGLSHVVAGMELRVAPHDS